MSDMLQLVGEIRNAQPARNNSAFDKRSQEGGQAVNSLKSQSIQRARPRSVSNVS